MGILMRNFTGFTALALCFCAGTLFAQEMTGRGWTVSESEQRASGPSSLKMEAPFPVLVRKPIVYPSKAVRRGWEGQTVVAAEVLPDGSVGRTELARSSGYETLDHAAEDSIKTWKFSPPGESDESVPQYVDIPVTFKLKDAN